MKRLTLITIVVIFLSPLHILADQAVEDVVYLKNGGIVRGLIVEQIPGVSIKIKTRDQNVFVYKLDEVERMTKESTSLNNPQNRTYSSSYKEKNPFVAFGWSFLIVGGGQIYNGEYGKAALQLGTVLTGSTLFYLGTSDEAILGGAFLVLGGWIWTLVDAPISANRINRENERASYGHLIQRDYNNFSLGLDFSSQNYTPTLDLDYSSQNYTPSVMLTLHF